jgi:hypothetical protein
MTTWPTAATAPEPWPPRRNLALGPFAIHGITAIKQAVQSIGRNPLGAVPLITFRHTGGQRPTLKSPWRWPRCFETLYG